MSHYLSQSLNFKEDKIWFAGPSGTEYQVMMDWEHPLMSASAAYVCQNGGDILEIGFGMGISAGYIQSHSISSHTVLENHPDIIPLALEWAAEKPNVTIITGSWYDNLNILSTYDGVFHDTYADYHLSYFSSSLTQLVKSGGVATWWNILPTPSNIHNIPEVTYQEFEINPPQNSYFNHSMYFLPKKQF
jgi:type IV protein arginine methyltransferase